MGKRGPQKQPQSIMDLKGNPEKRKRLPDAIKSNGDPTMPLWLSVDAMEIFQRVIGAMPPGFYTDADSQIIAMYAQACAMAKEATLDVQRNGITVDEEKYDKEGVLLSVVTKRNPAQVVLSDCMAKIATLGTRLGLDPTARQSIAGLKKEDENNNGFGDLLGLNGRAKLTPIDGGKK